LDIADLVHTEREARKNTPAGLTVADLKAKGATQLAGRAAKACNKCGRVLGSPLYRFSCYG